MRTTPLTGRSGCSGKSEDRRCLGVTIYLQLPTHMSTRRLFEVPVPLLRAELLFSLFPFPAVYGMIDPDKAKKRSSTFEPDFRKPLGDAKRRKGHWELALELLPQICQAGRPFTGRRLKKPRRRVDADGGPPLQGKSIRRRPVLTECMQSMNESGTA